MRRTAAVVVGSLMVLGAGVLAAPGTAMAARGFDVQITELPGAFTAGQTPSNVTVVASTDQGRRCQKVRWSMVVRVDGVTLDKVRVNRVEETRSVPLSVQTQGDTARLTDATLDSGELCRGRTVTARYQIAFTEGAADGRVTLQAQALGRNQQLLQQASATLDVLADGASASPSPSESDDPSAAPSAAPRPSTGAVAAVPSSSSAGSTSLLGVGLIVGGILIFLGVGLLLRMRGRAPRFGRLFRSTS